MKKAFTLIELLAVVVILTITFALIFPSLKKILNSANNTGLSINDQMIINAAKEYASEYNSSFLQDLYETGDVLYVSVDTLRDANLIDDIETNYQAVKIELLENDKITYELTNNIIDEIVITFNANNGSVSPSTKTVTYGSVYGNLPTPTKSNYIFGGWYKDTTYTKKVNETDIVRLSKSTTLFAKWINSSLTITLNAGEGVFETNTGWTNGSDNRTTCKDLIYGSTYGSLPTPTRTGYIFEGWYKELACKNEVTSETIILSETNHMLYAKWTLNSVTVTLNAVNGTFGENTGWTNGSDNRTTYKDFIYSSAYGTFPTPTRTGYTFEGWYKELAYINEVTPISIVEVMTNHMLYAKWTANTYTLTFNANSGSVNPSSKTVACGSTYGEMPIPTRTDYTFIGWYTSSTDGTRVTSDVIMGTSNVTVYAYWVQSVYTFDYTGAEQTFTTPEDGYYKLEVWGAQGGGVGGYGGYSTGTITLNKDVQLFISVGGQGGRRAGGWNGGGDGQNRAGSTTNAGYGGGGATHISLQTGLLKDLSSYVDDILIVSGAGGGGSENSKSGGYGGGINGGGGSGSCYVATGGTQTSGGTRGDSDATSGGFGYGGNAPNGSSTSGTYGAGGGGGGYYGGGGNSFKSASSCAGGGAGGSGYIGNSDLFNKYMYCYNCTTSDDETSMTITGTCTSDTPTIDCSKENNGYVRITYLGT